MVIFSEVNAVTDLLRMAGTFAENVKDGWYKSSTELRTFPVRVMTLSQKHEERLVLLRKFGLSDDVNLSKYVEEAEKILSAERERASRLEKSSSSSSKVVRRTEQALTGSGQDQMEKNKWERLKSRVFPGRLTGPGQVQMEKNKWERWKSRVFPGRLTEILGSMEVIVDASLQRLKARVEENGVLEQNLNCTKIPLPFLRDPNYVPIAQSIAEVRTAVESVEGSRVVVVHGDGGLGKTCLVKYIALHYDEVNRKRLPAGEAVSQLFPDGVFYLKCGKGGSIRINELEQELHESLGSGSEARADKELEGGYQNIPSRAHKSLRFKLATLKSLIVLDDVHESKVLERLLIPGNAVTYLITSRRRDILPGRDVRRIPMEKPSLEDATKILGMYTELAEDIEEVIHPIIKAVGFHPLMLANIGLAMGSIGRNGRTEWKKMAKGWKDKLQRTGFKHQPALYQELYKFNMEESINLMMDSLEEGERSLLRLMSLLENERLPEVVVKFFRKSMEPEEDELDYISYINKLCDKSLLEVYSPHVQGYGHSVAGIEDSQGYGHSVAEIEDSQTYFAIHRLRALYIRNSSSEQLKSMAIRALEPVNHINNYCAHSWMPQGVLQEAITTTTGALRSLAIWRSGSTSCGSDNSMITGSREGSNRQPAVLTAIMAAMYVDKSFWDAVEPFAHSLLRAPCLDLSIIPGNVHATLDVMDLVKRARDKKRCITRLVKLLNPYGEEGWEQKAHHYVTKIIVRFICRQELDDISVAQLVKLQNTTVIICRALQDILNDGYWASEFVDRKITFSSAHSVTTKTFLDHLHDNTSTISIDIFDEVILTLKGRNKFDMGFLNYEDEDTIFNIGEALIKMISEDTNNDRRDAFISRFFESITRTAIVMGKMPDLGIRVLRLLVDKVTSNQTVSGIRPMQIVRVMSKMKSTAPQLLDVPGALDMLWARIVSNNEYDANDAMRTLTNLTRNLSGELDNVQRVLSNRIDLVNLLNSLSFSSEGGLLRGMFLNSTQGFPSWSEQKNDGLVDLVEAILLLGNLGITKEVRETIFHFCPGVLERLQTLEHSVLKHAESLSGDTSSLESEVSQRTLTYVLETKTILSSTLVNSTMTDYNPPISTETFKSILEGKFYGLVARKMYKEALDVALDVHFDKNFHHLRNRMISTKAMVEDYRGALTIANDILVEYQQQGPIKLESAIAYAHRGMLTRLSGGSLAEAFADFDVSLNFLWSKFFEKPEFHYLLNIYYILKQRGFAKYLSGDNTGAMADAQTAQDLQLRNLVWGLLPSEYNNPALLGLLRGFRPHYYNNPDLLELRTDYIGFVFSF